MLSLTASAGAVAAVEPSPSLSPASVAGAEAEDCATRKWRSKREVVDRLSPPVSGKIRVSDCVFL
jgi:hypothetical protein